MSMFRIVTSCGAAVLALSTCAAFADGDWAATETHALAPVSSIVTSPVADDLPLHVLLSLKLRDRGGLEQFLSNLHTPGNPQYGQFLSADQFRAQYAPTSDQVSAVTAYLKQQGFRNIQVASNNLLVQADGTAAVAQRAFNTVIAQYTLNGKTVHSAVQDVMVPSTLGDTVLAVLGLQNAVQKHTELAGTVADVLSPPALPLTVADAVAPAAVPDSAASAQIVYGFTTADLRQAYDAGTAPQGDNTAVAITTAGDDDSGVIADLRQAEKIYGLAYVPVEVVQAAPLPDPQDTSGDGEWDLDTQSSTGIASNVKQLILYNATDLGDSLLAAWNAFAAENRARALNISIGGCEVVDFVIGSAKAEDQAFMQAVAQGQTVFTSSGDAGAACGVAVNLVMPDTGVPSQVEYPASSPYVISVGGTSLFTDSSSNYALETSWAAGGGGISLFEKAPDWQAGAGVVSADATRRGVPDIAMVAGLDINAQEVTPVFASALYTYSGGVLYRSIGTSLSAPLAAGVWARAQSAHCNQLGFAAPLIYALDSAGGVGSKAAGFTDIILGTNGEYVAAPGWDYNTGFGTFDIALFLGALPAVDCPANAPPVAQLSLKLAGKTAPLTATVNAGKSKDADGDGVDWYVMDYDDNTPPVFQRTAKFPPHVYAAPGVYTASLTVRDGRGAVSAPAKQTVTVPGTPLACAAGGLTMMTSPAGATGIEGVDPGSGTDDLLSVSVGEPAGMDDKLVFTMKVDNLKRVQPGLRWLTYFTIPDDKNLYFVSMTSSDGVKPVFNYGVRNFLPGGGYRALAVLGKLDAASNYTADGTITLVLDKSALKLKTGDRLFNLTSYVALAGPDASSPLGGVALNALDLAGTAAFYTLVGNDICAGAAKAGAKSDTASRGLFLGAFGPGLLFPLAGLALLRRRRR